MHYLCNMDQWECVRHQMEHKNETEDLNFLNPKA